MYSIWIIAGRQFTENIFSLRLLIGLIVCFALFVSSTYVLTEDYEKRLSIHNAAEIEHRNALEAVKVYSHLKVDVTKPPEPLSVICLGMERQLGSYDSISGEAETGTLRLCLSNSLPRATLLFGKYIGTIISLLIPLIIGICMNILVISLFGALPFESTYWLQIGGVILFSVLYISVFATLGLFISCLTRNSSVSLVLLLLVWVCFVVFIPRTGGLLASRLAALPDEKTIARQADDTMHDIRKRYGEGRFSARWSPGEPLTRSARIGDAKQAIYNEYRQQQLHQVKLAQNISRVSPTAIYQIGCEALVGTGIKHYERFFKKAAAYRRSLLQFTYEEYPFNPNLFLEDAERQQLTELKISLDKIPKFGDTLANFSTSFAQASLDILLLFLFNLVFFMGASLAFTRYDL
ncbi:MAG: ABC transporter permease subunit [Candidatus Poribacteria bacterium]|nr:ABC transporter permease subunit [Candidatus Poribacteria bacterium]